MNLTAIYSAHRETSLQDLAGFWAYNQSFDISKYEDFDHSKFLGENTLQASLSFKFKNVFDHTFSNSYRTDFKVSVIYMAISDRYGQEVCDLKPRLNETI